MAMHTRREVLRAGVVVAGAAALPTTWGCEAPDAAAATGEGPLPAPPFYWGIGLENAWMPQADPSRDGRRRPLDAFEQTQHYRKWKEDLQRAADLGVNTIRYSVPWHRAEPRPGRYDWSLIDGPVEHLVTKLGIIPVMDILHYGTPTWMEDGPADDRFVDALTAYSAAMAGHFRGLVNHYTPQNDPQINALFCAGTGRWPPYEKTQEAWSKLGVKLARALVLQSRAIRQEAPEAVLISAEHFVTEGFAHAALSLDPEGPPAEEVLNDIALFPSSLALGRLDPAHPLATYLVQNGVTEREVGWFQTNFATPDIHGVNCFPEMEVAEFKGDYATADAESLEEAAREAARYTEERCRAAYGYHRAPIFLTQTSAGLTAEKKIAYMEAMYRGVLAMRADGIPIRGVNWWPLFDGIQWEYREESSQPMEAFLRPGGWNNGLYVSQVAGGDMARVHTPAADSYRDIIRTDMADPGLVRSSEGRRASASPEAAAILAMRAVSWEPTDPPNTPMGAAQGIMPGRVTWVRDARVTPWDGKTGFWWEEGNINQPVLDAMFARSLNVLADETSNEEAWDALFRHFNAKNGRGDRGWQPGELIAIKINMNNSSRPGEADNNIDQSNHGLRAMLAQLTGPGKVDPACIVVYDATRAIPDRLFLPLNAEFPKVRWVVGRGIAPGREEVEWVENAITYTSPEVQLGNSLPKCCVDAAYLINMALLKGHEISGITLCAKNHFGSIMTPSRDHNKYVAPHSRDITAWSGYVDLMGSPNLGGKTMLYVLDGLYATQTNVRDLTERDRWRRLFGGEWSASLFLSQDPVAIDSVGLDFLRAEFQDSLGFSGARAFPKGSIVNSDNYLHEAALGRNVVLGPYRPNGKEIGSLGVHEHWNNATDRQYSRNLDPRRGKGIELVEVPIQG